MPVAAPKHPEPIPSLPAGLDPDSADSLRRFVRAHSFPSAEDGRFLFAFVDEEERYASVRLRHGLASHRNPPTLHRCAGGLHMLELAAPFVNRVEYRFETIDHDGVTSLDIDPLNPHTVRDPFAQRSVIANSAYAPPKHVLAPPPQAQGDLESMEIDGPIGKPWPTWIWSPPRIARTDALPVIVFLDGGDWLQLAAARNILENLVASKSILPCRAVFVKPAARNEEYAVNPRTAKFLAEELPRAMAKHFPWPGEAKNRIAVGCSLGGLCLLYTHFNQPSAFGGLILQSGSFFQPHTDAMESGFPWFGAICDFVSRALGGAARAPTSRATSPASAGRDIPRIPIHMTSGMGEENHVNNLILAEALTRQDFGVTYRGQPDAHNWTCWRDSVGEGLMRLLKP